MLTKSKIVLTISAVFLTIFLFFGYNLISIKTISTDADYILHELSEIEDIADLVVTAQLKGNIEQHIEFIHEETPINWYTISELKITNVLSGEIGRKENINIIEPYAVTRDVLGSYLFTTGDYVPLKKGSEYILFLVKSSGGNFPMDTYEIVGHYQGKYKKGDLKITNEDLEIGELSDHYKKLYNNVEKKYGRNK